MIRTTTPNRALVGLIVLTVLVLIPRLPGADAPAPIQLRKDDVIYIIGDSTTFQGCRPSGYVSLVSQAIQEQLPDANIQVFGDGYNANTSDRLLHHVKGGAIPKHLAGKVNNRWPKPTMMLMNFGLNDSKAGDARVPKYVENNRKAVELIREAKVRPVFCATTLWGDPSRTRAYAEAIRKLGSEMDVPVIDLYGAHAAYFDQHMKDGKFQNAHENMFSDDGRDSPLGAGVHLSAVGDRLSAETILKAFGLKPEWKKYPVEVDCVTRDGKNGWVRTSDLITIEPRQAVYEPGAKVTVTVKLPEGAKLLYWYGNIQGTGNPVTLTVNQPLRIQARLGAMTQSPSPAPSTPSSLPSDTTSSATGTSK